MAEWSVSFKRLAEEIYDGDFGEAQRDIALQALRGVVTFTPVDTGRARGAWLVSNGEPSGIVSQLEFNGDGSAAAAKAISAGVVEISKAKLGRDIIIENNVEYAVLLEKGPLNYSTFKSGAQAPARMVDRTVQRLASE